MVQVKRMSKLTKAGAIWLLACFMSLALLLGSATIGQSAPAPAHKLPTIPFEKYKLKKGAMPS